MAAASGRTRLELRLVTVGCVLIWSAAACGQAAVEYGVVSSKAAVAATGASRKLDQVLNQSVKPAGPALGTAAGNELRVRKAAPAAPRPAPVQAPPAAPPVGISVVGGVVTGARPSDGKYVQFLSLGQPRSATPGVSQAGTARK